MSEQRSRFAVPPIVKWTLAVMLLTLVADCLYVMWPYPDHAHGLDAFHANVEQERALLLQIAERDPTPINQRLYGGLYSLLFKWTGFDHMISRAYDPRPLDGGGELMRKAVLTTSTFWGTAITGLQLFCARLAAIVLSLPLVLLSTLAAVSDGMLSWFRRRTAAGRESGFVYHRAKRYTTLAVLALGVLYLVPPIVIDPRIPLSTFPVMIALTLRVAAASFKKYV